MRRDEEVIHNSLLDFIRKKYPNVIFRSDGAGLNLTIGLAKKFSQQQSQRAYPDVFIAHPTGDYSGLMIEIKKDSGEVLTKKLGIRNTKHIQEQHAVLKQLNDRGYYAMFGCGIDECMMIVDAYMENNTKILRALKYKYWLSTLWLISGRR